MPDQVHLDWRNGNCIINARIRFLNQFIIFHVFSLILTQFSSTSMLPELVSS